MKVLKQSFYQFCLAILCTVALIVGCNITNAITLKFLECFIICSTSIVFINCFKNCVEMNEILSPIFVANTFAAFVFIVRPIQVMLSSNCIDEIYTIGMYNRLGGGVSFDELPILLVNYIGFIGIFCMDIAYFGVRSSIPNLVSQKDHEDLGIGTVASALDIKQIVSIAIVMIPAFISMGSFVIKEVFASADISMIDIVWLYIICALVAFLTAYQRRASLFVYSLIAVSVLVLGLASRRMYAVNLIICFIVPLYYFGRNRKKTIKKIVVMVALLFTVVLAYGSIRASRIGAVQGTLIEQLMEEFCMYDMLLVSIIHCKKNDIGLFWGYNFLTVFTTVIPGIKIKPFDHALTAVVLNGMFNGGIPVTLFGSLYLNFSFWGLIIGSVLLGLFFRYIRNRYRSVLSVKNIIYYSIFTTFAYDIIRVGDIGREVWTCTIMILVAKIFVFMVPIQRTEEINE